MRQFLFEKCDHFMKHFDIVAVALNYLQALLIKTIFSAIIFRIAISIYMGLRHMPHLPIYIFQFNMATTRRHILKMKHVTSQNIVWIGVSLNIGMVFEKPFQVFLIFLIGPRLVRYNVHLTHRQIQWNHWVCIKKWTKLYHT